MSVVKGIGLKRKFIRELNFKKKEDRTDPRPNSKNQGKKRKEKKKKQNPDKKRQNAKVP